MFILIKYNNLEYLILIKKISNNILLKNGNLFQIYRNN